MPERIEWLGSAEIILVESDEDGWQLLLTTDRGRYGVNIHGVAEQLLDACAPIEAWLEEGRAAAATYVPPVVVDDYPPDDPKSVNYHDRMSGVWDGRADK